MDNAKALVKHSSWYEGEVQQTVRSLCNYYDIEPWACQPRRPKQKNRVEAGVGLAQRRIIAAMELERTPMARDLDHLNEQVKAKLEELNNAPFTATERSNSRRQMFEEEEREFLGRLPIVFTLESLNEDMLVEILKEPKNAILKQYKRLLELDEVKLEFDDDALRSIARKALEKDTGARALRSIIEDFMLDIMYEIPKDDSIGKVTITRDYIEHKGGPLIEMRGVPALEE